MDTPTQGHPPSGSPALEASRHPWAYRAPPPAGMPSEILGVELEGSQASCALRGQSGLCWKPSLAALRCATL